MACRRYAAIRRVPDGTRNGGRAKQGLKPLPIPAPSRWDGKTAPLELCQTPGTGVPPVAGRAGNPRGDLRAVALSALIRVIRGQKKQI